MSTEDDTQRRRWGATRYEGVVSLSLVAYLAAIVVFVLVAFGVTVGSLTELEEVAVGFALFALGHVLP